MSLRTKINGYTAWVNLRLTPYNQLLNNVLMDLLSGTNMKYFVESFTGREMKRLENLDGLSDLQKQNRVDWVIEEFKKCNIIPEDVHVDTRSFAMRNSDHVFGLLWKLISHDIWFVWERVEYLQVLDLDVLTQVPFKWTPDPPPKKKKSKSKSKKSLLSGFGASSTTSEDKPVEEPPEIIEDHPSSRDIACQTYNNEEEIDNADQRSCDLVQESCDLVSKSHDLIKENHIVEQVSLDSSQQSHNTGQTTHRIRQGVHGSVQRSQQSNQESDLSSIGSHKVDKRLHGSGMKSQELNDRSPSLHEESLLLGQGSYCSGQVIHESAQRSHESDERSHDLCQESCLSGKMAEIAQSGERLLSDQEVVCSITGFRLKVSRSAVECEQGTFPQLTLLVLPRKPVRKCSRAGHRQYRKKKKKKKKSHAYELGQISLSASQGSLELGQRLHKSGQSSHDSGQRSHDVGERSHDTVQESHESDSDVSESGGSSNDEKKTHTTAENISKTLMMMKSVSPVKGPSAEYKTAILQSNKSNNGKEVDLGTDQEDVESVDSNYFQFHLDSYLQNMCSETQYIDSDLTETDDTSSTRTALAEMPESDQDADSLKQEQEQAKGLVSIYIIPLKDGSDSDTDTMSSASSCSSSPAGTSRLDQQTDLPDVRMRLDSMSSLGSDVLETILEEHDATPDTPETSVEIDSFERKETPGLGAGHQHSDDIMKELKRFCRGHSPETNTRPQTSAGVSSVRPEEASSRAESSDPLSDQQYKAIPEDKSNKTTAKFPWLTEHDSSHFGSLPQHMNEENIPKRAKSKNNVREFSPKSTMSICTNLSNEQGHTQNPEETTATVSTQSEEENISISTIADNGGVEAADDSEKIEDGNTISMSSACLVKRELGTCENPNCLYCLPSKKGQEDEEKWVMFPNSEYVKAFKKKKRDLDNYPTPQECVLEMINYQLKQYFDGQRHPSNTRDGKGLVCYSIDDFVDSRVLCALVNSFVPNTFTADLLLNDRWTINLALKTAEKMFYAETPFDAEDLVEADPTSVCAYFAFFLMVAYRYRQTTAVVNRVDFINMLIRECNHDLEKFPREISSMQELQRRKDLKVQLDRHRQAIENLQKKFDIEFSRKWVQHVEHVQNELRREIRQKMRSRFEIVEVPRNITINDFALAAVINLSLTNGSGFYLSTSKESISEGRKLVLKNLDSGDYTEDFTNRSKVTVKDALGLPDKPGQVIEVNPSDYPEYEFYFEAPSRNKQLRAGSYFLYQVFPGNTVTWQRLFIKSSREAEYETVEKMIMFFREDSSFINSREPKSGNTALHLACKMGHFDIVRLLLENGASIDMKNNFKCGPINLAAEALQRKVCHYLIEWGCDVHNKNVKGQTVLETIKNDEFKRFVIDMYEHYSTIVPKIMTGDMKQLDKVIADHVTGVQEFCCLRSRCINGSTLLHTACYYGHIPAIRELLAQRVDVNIRDYKGATPLHRAKNPDIMELLLEAGAHVNADDAESNTPLHVKCYGETGQPSETECIQLLLNRHANMAIRNSRGLMPIHCCAMQGRMDLMVMMMNHDKHDTIAAALSKEDHKKPPSLIQLAIANDFPECAKWLLASGFQFKEKEQDMLLRRILTEQIKLERRYEAVKFLLDNGAEINPRYPGANIPLHYAAGLSGPCDVLELLVSYKAEVDAINSDGCTPLFFATQSNNKFAACVLIEQGANVRQKNTQGLTAFDYIIDFEEWIECGYFSEDIKARLKAFNLKHARDLIRAISKKVKPGPMMMRGDVARSAFSLQQSTPSLISHQHMSAVSGKRTVLPPVTSGDSGRKFITY